MMSQNKGKFIYFLKQNKGKLKSDFVLTFSNSFEFCLEFQFFNGLFPFFVSEFFPNQPIHL